MCSDSLKQVLLTIRLSFCYLEIYSNKIPSGLIQNDYPKDQKSYLVSCEDRLVSEMEFTHFQN